MLLAFLEEKPTYPKLPQGLSDDVALLCFGAVLLLALWAWTRSESVRRSIAGLGDPRVYAVLRIGFAVMTVLCFVNLGPYWRMLWSDEGLFTLQYAQDRLGRSALRGWTPEEGFLDIWAYACFLWNKPSLLYLWGSPSFVYGYMAGFFLILVMYGLGLFSRVTGVLAWFLMSGIYNRNALYWEGTDTVYRCFWFILLFARTGHAWSLDNWLRCRRLRKRGQLHEGEGPVPAGKQPVYRLVPDWPRYLFMIQLTLLYSTTGFVKTGGVWRNGDALYFALNMDHFYRFEMVTQYVSWALGTNVFKVMTWVTWLWEKYFPLALIGVILRFGIVHRDRPWWQAQHRGWRKWLGRGLLVGAYLLLYRVVWTVYPWSIKTRGGVPPETAAGVQMIHVLALAVVPGVIAVWFALGRWPLVVLREPRKIWKIRLPRIVITQDLMRVTLTGRRVWLFLGFTFHGILILFMNIGMFPFIMLMTYAAWISGDEWRLIARLVFRLLKRVGLGRLVPSSSEALCAPAEPAGTVRRRGGRMPEPLVLVFVATAAYFLFERHGNQRPTWLTTAGWWYLGALVITSAVLLFRPRSPRDEPDHVGAGPASGRTALGRTFAVFAVLWHGSAVAMHLFPSFPILGTFRSQMRVHSGWLRGTGTTQSWNMFAPNPPQANTFMITEIVEADGDVWDIRNNAWGWRPNPWIINDRMRKMQRRMVGKGKWYLRYWSEYHCREWTLRTGETPDRVEIDKIVTRIPGPNLVRKKGPFNPRKLKSRRTPVEKHECARGDGKLPVYMKDRYGLPVTPEEREAEEDQQERNTKKWENRKRSWLRRRDWGGGPEAPEPAKPRPPAPPPATSVDAKRIQKSRQETG